MPELQDTKEVRSHGENLTNPEITWAQQLKYKISKALGKESPPNSPRVSIDIFYSPHRTEADVNDLEEHMQNADIFFPEAPGWTSWALDYYQRLSRGEITPERVLEETGWSTSKSPFYSMRLRELQMIQGSNKVIEFVDVPNNHRILKELEEVPRIRIRDDFPDTLSTVRDWIENLARIEREREEYIIAEIPGKIQEILSSNPQLANKKEVAVLLHLGAGHTFLSQQLKREGLNVKKSFPAQPYIFSYRDEALRRQWAGKGIDAELLARILLESELYTSEIGIRLEDLTRDTHKAFAALRKIVSKYNLDDIRTLFKKNESDFEDKFKKSLKNKELSLPESEAELDTFLKD